MRRKALLLHPPYYEFGDYGYNDMPAMGLLKIAAHLRSKDIDVEYHDFSHPMRLADLTLNLKQTYVNAPFSKYVPCGNFDSEGIAKPQKYYGAAHSIIRQIIRKANPTEIWLSTGLTYYWEGARDVAIICKEEHPDVPLLVGGIYATLYPDHCRDHLPADYVHVGPLDDIDHLMPDYAVDELRSQSTVRTIQLGKGCNVNPPCSFCAVVSMDPKFKALNSDKVFNYIKEEYEKGVIFFKFWSSQLLVPQSRMINLMKRIIKSDIKIQMVASEGVQPSLFTQEISDLMLKAGFHTVSIPMESINESDVEDFRKPSTFKDYENAVQYAQKSGFDNIKSFVMVGIPGQKYDDIIHAIVDCWARDVRSALHQYTPIPGSYDWTQFKQFHDMSPEQLHPSLWPGADDNQKVEYLEEIKRVAQFGPIGLERESHTKEERIEEVWNTYRKWCRKYGIFDEKNRFTYTTPLAIKGYESKWKKRLIKKGLWKQQQHHKTKLNIS